MILPMNGRGLDISKKVTRLLILPILGLSGCGYLVDDVDKALASGYYRRAATLLQTASEGGSENATRMLGNLYQFGLGMKPDAERAARLYSQAAFSGSVGARIDLGLLYKDGRGVEKNGQLSYAWFNLARVDGHPLAQYYMSELLADHQVTYHIVPQLLLDYATLDTFPRLH